MGIEEGAARRAYTVVNAEVVAASFANKGAGDAEGLCAVGGENDDRAIIVVGIAPIGTAIVIDDGAAGVEGVVSTVLRHDVHAGSHHFDDGLIEAVDAVVRQTDLVTSGIFKALDEVGVVGDVLDNVVPFGRVDFTVIDVPGVFHVGGKPREFDTVAVIAGDPGNGGHTGGVLDAFASVEVDAGT